MHTKFQLDWLKDDLVYDLEMLGMWFLHGWFILDSESMVFVIHVTEAIYFAYDCQWIYMSIL